MGKSPGPLERAAEGDDDALEHVLGSVVGPAFDTALHWHGGIEDSDRATVRALVALARAIRSPEVPEDPLLQVLMTLVTEPPAYTHELPPSFDDMSDDERRVVVLSLAGGVTPHVLEQVVGDGATARLDEVIERMGGRDGLQLELDELGAAVPLPEGMIDRALEEFLPPEEPED